MIDDSVNDPVGFVSYEWKGAPSGVIDAQAGGNALLGIDEAVRLFNRKQTKGFLSTSYEIPVKTGEGSWVAWILGLIAIPATAFVTGYAKKAGERMAERDFSEMGFTDIARKSIDALEHLFELIKHTKKTSGWDTEGVIWKENATIIGITNESNEVLYIPVEYLKWYWDLPQSTLKKLTAPIAKGRQMTIGASLGEGRYRTVKINHDELELFTKEDIDEDEFLFPELVHGNDVVIEGLVTRGNQETNSMGFQYHAHILNCVPATGSIRRFKPAMFLHCKVEATINRHVASLARLDYRPTLIVNQVIILESDSQPSLF